MFVLLDLLLLLVGILVLFWILGLCGVSAFAIGQFIWLIFVASLVSIVLLASPVFIVHLIS